MAYIGSPPAYQASGVRPRDEFTADGTQICFPLSQSVPGSFESGVTIVLDNVPQQPVEAFTVVDTRTLTLTSISGTFTVNETVTGTTSTATGTVLKVNLNNIVIRGLTGTFSSSETITGGTSTATATTTSVTINTGSGILFSEAPTAASILYVVHEGNATYNLVPTAASVGPSQLADNLRNFTVDTFTGDGTTTTFTLSDTPSSANSLLVMVDGIVQTRTTNYTLSGAVVTFTDAPDSSAAITIIHLGFSTISRTGLVDGSVTTAKIADGAITSDKIATGGVVTVDMADGSVTSLKIADGAIATADIADAAITTAKLATTLTVTHALGSASTPSITFTGDTNTGIFSPTADTIAFAEGGAEAMRIDSSGNVGIGTATPGEKLDVSGNIRLSGSDTYIKFINAGGYDFTIRGNNGGSLDFISPEFSATPIASMTNAGVFQFNSGYGSAATAYGCRAWVNFNGSGTPAIRGSGNVSSITDNGTGDYTVNFTTAMSDANYALSGMGGNSTTALVCVSQPQGFVAPTTSAVRIQTSYVNASLTDPTTVSVQIFR